MVLAAALRPCCYQEQQSHEERDAAGQHRTALEDHAPGIRQWYLPVDAGWETVSVWQVALVNRYRVGEGRSV